MSVSNDTVGDSPTYPGDSPGYFGSNSTNARDVIRKRSLDKEVKSMNSLSDVGLDIASSMKLIHAEEFRT